MSLRRGRAPHGAVSGYRDSPHLRPLLPWRRYLAWTSISDDSSLTALAIPSVVVSGVHLCKALPLLRQFVEWKDSRSLAHWNTSTAIDAIDRVNIELGHVAEPVTPILSRGRTSGGTEAWICRTEGADLHLPYRPYESHSARVKPQATREFKKVSEG